MDQIVIPPDLDAAPPPTPALTPNSLPPAYPSYAVLLRSALHPQLLILYSYFALIAWLLHRVVFRSVLAERIGRKAGWETGTWCALAALSLGSTWTYMLRYFSHSYTVWLSGAHLTGLAIPSLPVCPRTSSLLSSCHVSLLSTRLQRLSLWLTHTSLFTESWLQVTSHPAAWWWSAEVCLFTVGVFTLFLSAQRIRVGVPDAWAYMLLGQTVAMSFAAALFGLALSIREVGEGSLLQVARAGRFAGEERVGRVVRVEVQEDEQGAVVETTTRQYILECPSTHPSLASRLITWAGVGLASLCVWSRPTTLPQVLWMHLLPLVLLLPRAALTDRLEALLHPHPRSDDAEGTRASNERLRALLRPSKLFGALAAYNFVARLRQAGDVVSLVVREVPALQLHKYGTMRVVGKLLYPTTFHSHPAQSSIGSDAVCLGLVALVYIGMDAVRSNHPRTRLVAALLGLATPLVGPSATLSAWLAVREREVEEAECRDEERLRKEAGQGVGLVVEEEEQRVVRARGKME